MMTTLSRFPPALLTGRALADSVSDMSDHPRVAGVPSINISMGATGSHAIGFRQMKKSPIIHGISYSLWFRRRY